VTHQEEAELSVLGSMMLDNACIDGVSLIIRPADFGVRANRAVFTLMLAIHASGSPVDPVTLIQRAEGEGVMAACGGMEYVLGLTDAAATAVNVAHHASIVKLGSSVRAAQAAADAWAAKARELPSIAATDGPEGVASFWAGIAADAASAYGSAENSWQIATASQAIKAGAQIAHDRYAARADGKPSDIVEMPFDALSDIIGGFEPGSINILAAETGGGKTALAWFLAQHFAKRAPDGQVGAEYATNEVGTADMGLRHLAAEAGVDGKAIRRGLIVEGDIDRIMVAAKRVRSTYGGRLVILHQHGMTVEALCAQLRIRARARRVARDIENGRRAAQGLEALPPHRVVVCVDYYQRLRTEERFRASDEVAKLVYIIQMLTDCALETGDYHLVLSQLNDTRAPNGRPTRDSLFGSKAPTKDASNIILLHRPHYSGNLSAAEALAELLVVKGRTGGTGIAPLHFDGPTGRYREWSFSKDGKEYPGGADDKPWRGKR
jgi:replicative DNA helicase